MGGEGGGGGGGGGVGAWSVDSARAGAREMVLAPWGMPPSSCAIVPAIPVSPRPAGGVGGGFDMRGSRERLG